MTGPARQHARTLIDQAVRARRQQLIDAGEIDTCAKCGGDLDTYTTGCSTCKDRRNRRDRRSNAALLEHERAVDRERKRRSRARRATLASRPEGHLELVGSRSESPSGRPLSHVESVSATNRQSRET